LGCVSPGNFAQLPQANCFQTPETLGNVKGTFDGFPGLFKKGLVSKAELESWNLGYSTLELVEVANSLDEVKSQSNI